MSKKPMQVAMMAVCAAAALPLAYGAESVAQGVEQSRPSGWNIQVTPYAWGTGVGGTVRPFNGGPTAHMNESLSDVLKDLDAAFFINALVRKDAFVLHLDMTTASLSKSATMDVAPGTTLYGQAKIRQRSWGALAGYRWQQSSQSAWDWLGGVRYWDVRIDAQASLPGVTSRQFSIDRAFTYPVLAARWRYQWDDRWSTLAYLDAGGTGSGKSTWQTLLTVNYTLNQQWYLSAGYRYLSVKHEERGERVDLSQQGPLVGVTYRF